MDDSDQLFHKFPPVSVFEIDDVFIQMGIFKKGLEAVVEEIVFVLKISIEGRARDHGVITQLNQGDLFKRRFLQKLKQGAAEEKVGPPGRYFFFFVILAVQYKFPLLYNNRQFLR